MNSLFNMDNKFFTFMSRVADLVMLNVVFLLCCIPIFTIGASLTAMLTVTEKMVKNEESYIIRSFFKAFKDNFKQSTIVWLVALVVGIVLYMDLYIVNQMTGAFGMVIRFGVLFVILMYIMVLLYVFPIQAKFINTVRNTVKNALLMSIRHLPFTLLMLLITYGPMGYMLFGGNNVVFTYGLLAWILIGFSLTAFVDCMFFVKVFKNYIPAEETLEEDSEASADDTPKK